jgi:hypothetical protein
MGNLPDVRFAPTTRQAAHLLDEVMEKRRAPGVNSWWSI